MMGTSHMGAVSRASFGSSSFGATSVPVTTTTTTLPLPSKRESGGVGDDDDAVFAALEKAEADLISDNHHRNTSSSALAALPNVTADTMTITDKNTLEAKRLAAIERRKLGQGNQGGGGGGGGGGGVGGPSRSGGNE
jgi:hypothetical protein